MLIPPFPACLQFISFMKWLLGGTLSEFSLPLRALLTLAAFILRNVLLFYPLMLFMLLSWDLCFKVCLFTNTTQASL